MKNKLQLGIIFLTLTFFNLNCKSTTSTVGEIISRNYCTEMGRFDLLFYKNEVSGTYALLPKKSLGSVWGKLERNSMVGRWLDGDGQGDIIIEFSQDFSWFTTSYRSDKEPEKWYNDQWHGQLRPDNKPEFRFDGKLYKCE